MNQLIRCGATAVFLAAHLPSSALGQDAVTRRTFRINGTDMYVEVRGTGSPLVLLHGFQSCGETWQPHLDRLSQHYRVIVPDLRGHGRSTNPSGTFTHRQSALDVLTLLDSLGIRRFRAMGISTGGMTLIHIATQHQDRVEAMVLIGATSHFPEQARVIMRRQHPDSLTPQQWERLRLCAKQGDTQVRQLVGQFNAFKDSYDDMNFTRPYLGRITARTLIVHGDRDAFFPVNIAAEMFESISRASLWIVPDGGHVPIFGTRATNFQDVALAFLQSDGVRP